MKAFSIRAAILSALTVSGALRAQKSVSYVSICGPFKRIAAVGDPRASQLALRFAFSLRFAS